MNTLCSILFVMIIARSNSKLNEYIHDWERINQSGDNLVKRLATVQHSKIYLHFQRERTLVLSVWRNVEHANIPQHTLISGIVIGETVSKLQGYLDESSKFVGWITLNSTRYHIEPSDRYFPNSQFDSIMYPANARSKPLIEGLGQGVLLAEKVQERITRRKRHGARHESLSELKNRTCSVLLAADHFFFKHVGKGSKKQTMNELLLHLGEANKIFRSTDFDFDGRSDNIGFAVGNITIFEHENMAENKFFGKISTSSEYLMKWSQYDHSEYCLALCFTYRDFNAGVLGLAYVGARDRTGGICDRRNYVNGQKASFNTGIISLMNFGAYVGHDVSFIIVAHELGHNFGASHDPDSAHCSPGSGNGGNYVMYDKATNGDQPHNAQLSPCTRHAILDVLLTPTKTVCFRGDEGYCGNGIQEGDEECDCGNGGTCDLLDRCCVPADAQPPDVPCTIRQSRGYQCSGLGGGCCTSECMFAPNTTVCHEDGECSLPSSCSGTSGVCSTPEGKGLNTLCNDKQNTCTLHGKCQGSVCSLRGLAECQCTEDEYMCDVCCTTEDNTCTSTRVLPHLDFNLTFLGPGQACGDYSGYCDDRHKCVTVNLEDPLSTLDDIFNKESMETVLNWVKVHWYYSISILAGCVCLLLLFKYTYVKRVPLQRALHKVSVTLRGHYSPPPQFAYSAVQSAHKHMPLGMAVDRLSILFPTAELEVLVDVAGVVATEEVAVKRLLALDYPMSRSAVELEPSSPL